MAEALVVEVRQVHPPGHIVVVVSPPGPSTFAAGEADSDFAYSVTHFPKSKILVRKSIKKNKWDLIIILALNLSVLIKYMGLD